MLTGIVTDPTAAAQLEDVLRPELCAPAVVWLAHEACTASGQVYQVHGGRAARVVIGEPDGYWDRDLTPESFRNALAEIESDGPLTRHTDSYAHASAIREHWRGALGDLHGEAHP